MGVTPERLRELYDYPAVRPANKVIDHFDHHCQAFISNATFLILATTDGMHLDVSPKGDPAGFVEDCYCRIDRATIVWTE